MRPPERILAALLVLCWLCAGEPALADTTPPLRIAALEYRFVDDPDTTLDTLLQAPSSSWQRVDGSRLNLGITRSVLWLRVELPTVPAPGQRLSARSFASGGPAAWGGCPGRQRSAPVWARFEVPWPDRGSAARRAG